MFLRLGIYSFTLWIGGGALLSGKEWSSWTVESGRDYSSQRTSIEESLKSTPGSVQSIVYLMGLSNPHLRSSVIELLQSPPQSTQSTELTRGPPELVQQGGVHIGARACMSWIWYGLAESLAIPVGKRISTAFATRREMKGGGGCTLWSPPHSYILFYFVNQAEKRDVTILLWSSGGIVLSKIIWLNVVFAFAGSCRVFYASLFPPDPQNPLRHVEGRIAMANRAKYIFL